MKYSVIIPVYNRPGELRELLDSLSAQKFRDFEVIVVEDGSAIPSSEVVKEFANSLDIKYFVKENGGPGPARNFGAERSGGEYLIILDSDVILPQGYFDAVETGLSLYGLDAFGGPDRSHPDFTPVQKAISYAMTSFFTTGGIRGGGKALDKFYPRSFNMGVRGEVFNLLKGFSPMRFGEDIDLSIRIFKCGYRCRLIPDAWVWHKRRTDLRTFFRQVHNSGIARINLYKKWPDSLKLVHLLPALFTIGCTLLAVLAFFWPWALLPLLLYALAIFIDSLLKSIREGYSRPLQISLLSVAASFVQLIGYGSGFIRAWFIRCVLGRGNDDLQAFKNNFYK